MGSTSWVITGQGIISWIVSVRKLRKPEHVQDLERNKLCTDVIGSDKNMRAGGWDYDL